MAESKIAEVARAIDPSAFSQFESMRDYCRRNGDDDAEALRTAEWAHGHSVRLAMEKARAAIEAMRVPTPVMIAAGKFRYRDIDLGNGTTVRGLALGDDPFTSYQKMIDAALSEEVAG